MDCRRVDSWLPAYLDDALPAWQARGVASHLAACPRCRREQQTLEAALRALDRVGSRAPAIDLWASFAERLAAETPARVAKQGPPSLFIWRPAAGAAAMALAAAACFLGLVSTPPVPPGVSETAWRSAASRAQPFRAATPDPGERQIEALRPLAQLPSVVSPEGTLPANPPSTTNKRTHYDSLPLAKIGLKAPPSAPQIVARAEDVPPTAIRQDDLASVAEALMDAPQDAARTQVANEVIVLAQEMVRMNRLLDDRTEGSL